MISEQKLDALSAFPLFQTLSKIEFVSIVPFFEDKTIPKGSTFIKEGHIEEEIYFILSGLVRIYNLHESGKEMTVTLRLPGEIIGEMALLNGSPRSASIQAIEETRVLLLHKEHFEMLLVKYPQLSIAYLKILSERLRQTIHAQKTLSFASLEERTYSVLKQLSIYFIKRAVTLTHEQLSVLVNATQPRVTEVLNSLQKNNKISLSRKKIFVN